MAVTALSMVLAASTAWLFLTRSASAAVETGAGSPAVGAFRSQISCPGRPTDVVLDDAAVGSFQELPASRYRFPTIATANIYRSARRKRRPKTRRFRISKRW
jgi:hypothetical protein